MATLTLSLPRPQNSFNDNESRQSSFEHPNIQQQHRIQVKQPPPYGQRQGFIPRTVEDFGDGGAFPEIHVAQYPLDMGRRSGQTSSNSAPITLDSQGKIKYEAILGHGPNKIVHASSLALVERTLEEEDLQRPDEEAEAEATAKTRAALEGIVNGKIVAARAAQPAQKQGAPTYIRYTPQSGGDAHNSGAKQRIIRMVEMPKDPMEPPKFKHKRVPGGPPSPPAPVMHSPPRKITVEDQQVPPPHSTHLRDNIS